MKQSAWSQLSSGACSSKREPAELKVDQSKREADGEIGFRYTAKPPIKIWQDAQSSRYLTLPAICQECLDERSV